MIKEYQCSHVRWVALENPTQEEVQRVMQKNHVEAVLAHTLLSTSKKARAGRTTEHLFATLHFPIMSRTGGPISKIEIDFIIGKEVVITAHSGEMPSLFHFRRQFETNIALAHHEPHSAEELFLDILQHLYRSMESELEGVDDAVRDIEQGIFSNNEHKMVGVISHTGRLLLDFGKVITSHTHALTKLAEAGGSFFSPAWQQKLELIITDYERVVDTAKNYAALLAELRSTNDSLLTTKQNETMKFFTILAFFVFPISLLLQILTMSAVWNPFIGIRYDFWIILGIVAFFSIFMYIIFKLKKWL